MTEGFCVSCGGELRQQALYHAKRLVCLECGRIAYPALRVAVSTIPYTRENRILLVRRAIHPGFGCWVIPGGYREIGEDLYAAAVREMREEVGLRVNPETLKFSGLYSYREDPTILVVYDLLVPWQSVLCGPECMEAAWFPLTDLPWEHIYFRSTHDALRHWIAASGLCQKNSADTEVQR